jgi:hypothetical protein
LRRLLKAAYTDVATPQAMQMAKESGLGPQAGQGLGADEGREL